MHTTNYTNTFIQIAEDSLVTAAEVPPLKGDKKTVANLQFEMIAANPYKYTSDDVIFNTYALKNKIAARDMQTEREKFFSKGQACLRCSPLGKRYGWGTHHNHEGKVALFAIDSPEYHALTKDKNLKQLKAMRSKKA